MSTPGSSPAWLQREDRRQKQRVPFVAAVRKTTDHKLFLCQSTDVSTHGMGLRRAKGDPLALTTTVWLEFSLPGFIRTFRVPGIVVRDESDGRYCHTGIRFVKVSATLQDGLARLLAA